MRWILLQRLFHRRASAVLILAGGIILPACDESPNDVDHTVPSSNEEGVHPRTIIGIEFNNSFTSKDSKVTDPANISVTGNLSSSPYAGTLVLTRSNKIRHGQTVEDFKKSGAGTAPAPAPDPPADTKDPAPPKPDPNDTIVFLLADNTRFKSGETIRVEVSDDVTSHGTPIRKTRRFSFRVRDDDGEGGLKVKSTIPRAGAVDPGLRPRISAVFSRAVKSADLGKTVVVRGSQSGVHTGGEALVTKADGSAGALEISWRLGAGDSFLPGETVDAAFPSAITGVSTTAGAATKLTPHLLRFQVKPGRLASGTGSEPWNDDTVLPVVDGPVRSVAADFRPAAEGVEVLTLGESSAGLHFQLEPRVWTSIEAPLELSAGSDLLRPVDAAVHDVDEDGIAEGALLLTGASKSRLEVLRVDDAGDLVRAMEPIDLPAAEAHGLASADLDGNGKPELLVTHPASSYVPSGGGAARATGHLSILELRIGPPTAEELAKDPTNILPRPRFELLENPIQGFGQATRIQAVDVHGDGRLDLLSEMDGTLALHRNVGSADTQYAFLQVGKAPAGGGATLRPLAWVASDLDKDGSIDLLAWDANGGMISRDLSGGAFPEPQRFIGVGPVEVAPALAAAADMDGDGITDAAVVDEEGTIHVVRGGPQFPLEGEVVLPGAGLPPASLALADLDGDTGLDLVALDPEQGVLDVRLSNVSEPANTSDSRFRFGEASPGKEDTLRVPVLADIADRFKGYSVAVDYDEKVLTYKGFERPPGFDTNASFTLCPDAQLQGCSGNASAKMSYLQGTVGGPGPGQPPQENVLLGTLIFARKDADADAVTLIELESFTGSGNTKLENTLSVVDGGGSADIPVLLGDPLVLDVTPPPPPDLRAECTVVRRNPSSLDGRVTWSSPSGRTFPPDDFEYEVAVQGEPLAVLSASETSHTFTTSRVGTVQVVVSAVSRDTGRQVAATAGCEVIGIHQPIVDCFAVSDTENRITWILSHNVTGFAVYRNGVRIHQAAPGEREFSDRSPSTQGGDVYEVAGVLGSTEGPRGRCNAIGDPDPGTTLPPRISDAGLVPRIAPSEPNVLRIRWVNGEGYESVRVTLERSGESSPFLDVLIDGGATELVHGGDGDPGGVKPGQYIFAVSGTSNGRASQSVRSSVLNVRVPPLGPNFACVLDGSGDAKITWDATWAGYDSLSLRVEHTQDGAPLEPAQTIPLSSTAREHTLTSLSPVGTYEIKLIAEYGASLPPPVRPSTEDLQRTCRLDFDPRMYTGNVQAGVGLRDFEIPIRADVYGSVSSFHFELEYPSFLEIDSATGFRVDHPGARIDELSVSTGGGAGTKKVSVTVSGIQTPVDADRDGKADGKTVLGALIGSVPPDFLLAGERDLRFVGNATLSFQGAPATPVDTTTGKIRIWRRYVVLDRAVSAAGSSSTIRLAVRGTFNAPPSAPDYKLNAFTIHLKWDPTLLEPLSITQEDQRETIIFKKGSYFLPNDAALATARITGELKASWIGFDFENPESAFFVTPGIDMKLLVVKFRSRVAGDRPATFLPIDFVSEPGSDNPTAFFPEVDVPTEPDLEGFLGGGVRITGAGGAFAVQSIQPGTGSLLGGNEAVITGSGFPAGGSIPTNLSIVFQPSGGGAVREVAPGALISIEPTRIRFRVPDSGLRQATSARPHDVVVRLGELSATLARGYAYEPLRIEGTDRTGGAAAGGEVMVIQGTGFAPLPSTSVSFEVPGVAQPFPAEVSSVEPDGTRILIITPDLRGQEGKTATVQVSVAEVGRMAVPTGYEIRTGGGGENLEITGVSPSRGTICGGLEVTISGRGFLPGLFVSFGSQAASSVELVDARTARVRTPSMPEGTETVSVIIANTTGGPVSREDGFTFEHPAPPFLRGDLSNDGSVSITDVVILADLVLGRDRIFPPNIDAADANDDGSVNTGDITVIMNALFGGAVPLPPPYPPAPASLDPTPDSLTSCPF